MLIMLSRADRGLYPIVARGAAYGINVTLPVGVQSKMSALAVCCSVASEHR